MQRNRDKDTSSESVMNNDNDYAEEIVAPTHFIHRPTVLIILQL